MKRKRSMMRVVPSTELKNQAGAVMRRVEQGEFQLVTRAGMPVGAIISMEEVDRYFSDRLTAEMKRKRAWGELHALLSSRPDIDVSEAEVEADVQKAVDAVRHGKRRKK